MMLRTTSISELHTATVNDISAVLAAPLRRAGNRYGSPLLLDLIVWNIVIAFAVGVAAHGAYDTLRQKLRGNGQLTSTDVSAQDREINAQVLAVDLSNENQAKLEVRRVLHVMLSDQLSSDEVSVIESILVERARRTVEDAPENGA